jgi:DNA-binding MarR family transcriptional regulator
MAATRASSGLRPREKASKGGAVGLLVDNEGICPYSDRAMEPDRPCNATAMRKASRRLTQLYDDALEPSGLRSTQFAILSELNRRSDAPPTMRELADALVMDRSALGHNLRPLERDGFIALKQSTEDRRRQHVVITAAGRAKHRVAKRLWQVAQDHFYKVFGKAEAEQLRATLLNIAHEERLSSVSA